MDKTKGLINIVEVNESEYFNDNACHYLIRANEDLEIACSPHVAEWLDARLNKLARVQAAARVNGKKGGRPVTIRRENK